MDIFLKPEFVLSIAVFLLLLICILIYRKMHHSMLALQQSHKEILFQEQEKIRIKKQLTHNINHELKTPVSAISGCLETLINHPELPDAVRIGFLEQSYNQTQRLSDLLRDVAVITHMDESEYLEKEYLKLSHIIDTACEDAIFAHPNSGMRINREYQNYAPLPMKGNPGLLHSVFRNLLDNALTHSGGRDIYIRYTGTFSGPEGSPHYGFIFADNGVGVDEEHLPHLFERFYRTDTGRSRKTGGTGLGLAIAKNAIMLHGGKITVSNKESGGLEFCFDLAVS